MKNVRSISKNPIVIGFSILVIVNFSCAVNEIPSAPNLSGREMMRAIFFADGSGIQFIPEFRDGFQLGSMLEGDYLTEARNNVNALFDALESHHPNIFSEFKADMTSGNHVIIEQALTKYSNLIYETIAFNNEDNPMFNSLTADKSPIAEIIATFFPGDQQSALSPNEIQNIVKSEEFKSYVNDYFQNLNKKVLAGGRSEEGQCVIWFAAVVVAVVYVAAVLEAVYLWTDVDVDWDDGVATPLTQERKETTSSLLKTQIVNSIAVNFFAE